MVTYEQFKAITEDKRPLASYYSNYSCWEDHIIRGVVFRFTWMRGNKWVEQWVMSEVDKRFSVEEGD